MYKNLLFFLFVTASAGMLGQECPTLTNPSDGAVNVPVDAMISWNAVSGVPGYEIAIGTTVGGNDILDQAVGSQTSFSPPVGLPENTQIFVTITLFFFDRPDITCTTESFRTEVITAVPDCTMPENPLDGANGVNGATNIRWSYAPRATGYTVSMGTSVGGSDLANNVDVGNNLLYDPPSDLPPDVVIYVRIVPYNAIGPASGCSEFSFDTDTGPVATLPGCTALISPANGETNVPLTPLVEWTPVLEATGYAVSIGTSPFVNDVLDNTNFFTTSTLVIDFDPNRNFYITIVPFNSAGSAIGCTQETFSTLVGCGPFFDPVTGELTNLNPTIDFPDEIGICLGDNATVITSTDTAEGFRWYKVNDSGGEVLLSDTSEVSLTEEGIYLYEAYNTITPSGSTMTIECESSKEFAVVSSEIATINAVDTATQNGDLRLEVQAQGNGDYEYALNNIDGPYQESNIFSNVSIGTNTVYVRDKNGCGIAEQNIERDLTVEGFPAFFTPNGDGANDFWQFIRPQGAGEINVLTIQIFDRYGILLAQIDPSTNGWDGRLNGKQLPASDYWFKAVSNKNKEIKGNFSLKR